MSSYSTSNFPSGVTQMFLTCFPPEGGLEMLGSRGALLVMATYANPKSIRPML